MNAKELEALFKHPVVQRKLAAAGLTEEDVRKHRGLSVRVDDDPEPATVASATAAEVDAFLKSDKMQRELARYKVSAEDARKVLASDEARELLARTEDKLRTQS